MKYKSIDREILIVVAITIIAVALVLLLPTEWTAVRILALPLVLVLPGYALVAAVFPEQARGFAERLLFSLALSLAIVILSGLLLNLTPWGLRANSWAVLLGGITLGACAVALIRRGRQHIPASGWPDVWSPGFTLRQGLLLGLAALIVCGAIALSIIGAERQPYPGFTQLWLLPGGGAYPKNAVNLGVSNMELTTMEYRIALNVNGKVVKEWPTIDLNPNAKWNAIIFLPQTANTGPEKVEVDLYRTNAPTTIYRHVVLWLNP